MTDDAVRHGKLEFRKALMADLPRIVELLADDDLGRNREQPSMPLDERYQVAFEAIDRSADQLLAVATLDGAVVGCVQITWIPGLSNIGAWRGQLESVRVARGVRGQRIGGRMIEWAIERCREHGCRTVQLTTDKTRTETHRFYEALGFVASHEGMKLKL